MSYHSSQDPEENLPDWLKALRKRQKGEPPQSPPASKPGTPSEEGEAPAEEEPSWLKEIRERYQREHDKQAEERLLSDTQPTSPFPTLEKRQIEGSELAREEPLAEEPPAEPESQIPDWLALEEQENEISDASEDTTRHTPAFEEGEGEISAGEIPSWLQAIRPGGTFPEEDTRSADMLPGLEETAGPLAGLSDVLPVEPGVVQPGKPPVFSARVEITEGQARHAATFRHLIESEAHVKEDHSKRAALPARVLTWVIAGGIFLATLFPLVTQSQSAPRPELSAFPESAEIFNLVDVLPAGAAVLVAFEVQPSLFGEVQVPAVAVLRHLLEKEARLVFISTQPTGPALAEKMLRENLSDLPGVATNNYTNLGYLSGGMAALRSFASNPQEATLSAAASLQDPWNSPVMQTIERLSDFALVLVLSSGAEDGRAWIEQTTNELNVGLVVVSSAQAAPLLRPYLESSPPRLLGLVSGLSGGAFYERLRAQDGLARTRWDAFSYGLGAIVLLALLGGLYNFLIHVRPEKPGGQVGGKIAR